jgi:hypothetical protein
MNWLIALVLLNAVLATGNVVLAIYNLRMARRWQQLHAQARKQLDQIEGMRAMTNHKRQ